MALYIRSYDLSLKYQVDPYYNLTLIRDTIDDLEIMKNKLDSISDYLKFCDEGNMIKENLISEYKLFNMKNYVKRNLIDLLTRTIQYVGII